MQLYNTLNRKKELFVPISEKQVTLYVCGITPYDTTHLGHAFTYISFDILVRWLTHKGYAVTYTQNVTDVNDRDKDILKRAKEQNVRWEQLAKYWTDRFLEDMSSLYWIMPNNYIKASESIPAMIDLIQKLLQKRLAYEKNGSVYFDIVKDKEYGKLSQLNYEQMIAISKDFEEDLDNPDKRNQLDITLWRSSSVNQPSHIPLFDSPFGFGRPGWHVECSAMSISTLGAQIDIHGGGTDLIYPHHEAEIAQAEGATGKKPFARHWMHTGVVAYKGEKMSKSKGNLIMISDLLKKYSPNAIRWVLLSNHYRTSWKFKEKAVAKAEETLQKLLKKSKGAKTPQNGALWTNFTKLIDNDLNTPEALSLIIKALSRGANDFVSTALQILGFRI